MEVRVEFGQIDARDNPLIGYHAVGFAALKPHKRRDGTEALLPDSPAKLGPKNGRLAVLMEAEYLSRVADLQADIVNEYMRLFDGTEPPATDNLYENGLTEDEYNAVKEEVDRRFPGPMAAVYT